MATMMSEATQPVKRPPRKPDMYHQSRERPMGNGHALSQSAVMTIISSATLTMTITTRPARIMRLSPSSRHPVGGLRPVIGQALPVLLGHRHPLAPEVRGAGDVAG